MKIRAPILRGAAAAFGLLNISGVHAVTLGAVYTMTNAAADNQVVVFGRDAQGLLTQTGMVSTGGKGSAGGIDPLGSQGSLVLAGDNDAGPGEWLAAVNAGSNDVSLFEVGTDGITLRDRVGSGGAFPVSVTVAGDRMYVLNNGAPATIAGFKLGHGGHLLYLPGSTRALGNGSYGQITFAPHAKALVITDKADNQILVFPLDKNGLPGATPVVTPSAGTVPFGLAFDKAGHLLVVEAGSNAVSSYRLLPDGSLQTLTASAGNGQLATCWITVDARGDIITTSPGTHTLSSFHVMANSGQVTLIDGTAGAGDVPLDIDLTRNGRFAYAVDPAGGGVDIFKIGQDGSLIGMGSVNAGLAHYAQGMAVR